MKFPGSKHLIVIGGAVLLFCIIAFLPRKGQESSGPAEKPAFDLEHRIEEMKGGLDKAAGEKIRSFEGSLKGAPEPEKVRWFDSLAFAYDRLHFPLASAFYFEKKAEEDGSESSWLNAAYRYFDSFKAAEDSLSRASLVRKAIDCYTRVITINPRNLNAKTDLGVCLTETPEPMKGIALLREVISENPEHENAQLNLGILSMKSGQHEKAIDRFNKVKQINPQRAETDLFLGEAYVRSGNTEQGIKHLEAYMGKLEEGKKKQEVKDYISTLKTSETK